MFDAAANANGDAVWQARVSGFGSGIFSDRSPDTIVVTKGQDVGGGYLFNEFDRPVVADNGTIAFHAAVFRETPPDLTERIYSCGGDSNCTDNSDLTVLVAKGDTYAGREICELDGQMDASNWGIGFRALTAPTGMCNSTLSETVLRKPYVGAIQEIATAGNPAPMPPGGDYFRFDGPPEIDNDGNIAVLAEAISPVQEVIYFCSPGCVSAVVQGIDDDDGNDLTRFKAVGLSDDTGPGTRAIVFQAVATSTTSKALSIYVAKPPGAPYWDLTRIAANQDVNVTEVGEYRRIGRPSMSSDGFVVFESIFKNVGSRFTLWKYDVSP